MLAFAAQERQVSDFTHPSTLYDNIRAAIAYIRSVLLSPTQIYDLTEFAEKASTGC